MHPMNSALQLQNKKLKDDITKIGKVSGSEVSQPRNRSAIPSRNEQGYHNQTNANVFTTNNNPNQMKQLGFGNDFLSFNVDGSKKDKANEEKKVEIIKRNNFENVEEIDFRTNNDFNFDNKNPFGQYDGSFAKKQSVPKNNSQNIDLLDL